MGFNLSDICEVLNIQNVSDVKSAIDREFDKGGRFDICPLETNGGKQNFIFITEPQLYFVLMRSDKPKAKPFRQWVVNEVLPSIRKHGFYAKEAQENIAQRNRQESGFYRQGCNTDELDLKQEHILQSLITELQDSNTLKDSVKQENENLKNERMRI